jgi:hypothetical protein
MMTNKEIAILVGLVVYAIGAYRTYRWMRQQLDSDVLNLMMGKPSKVGTFIAAMIFWWAIEVGMLLWMHDQSLVDGFEEKYEICPECKGRPLVTNYRAFWDSAKPPFRCPRCGGTGIVRKTDDQVDG